MRIAAIIVGIEGWQKYTLPLVESIRKHEPECEIVVIDNASTEEYPTNSHVVPSKERLCYSKAINFGKQLADLPESWGGPHDWYIVLSNDVLVTGPFAHLLAEQDGSAVVGPLMKRIAIEGVGEVPYIEGWCVAIPRHIWETIGGWDEGMQVSSYEDVEYSHRARTRGFGLEQVALPFTHLDQKQRFGLVSNYWESEAHNRARFIQKYAVHATQLATVQHVFNERSCTLHSVKVGDIEFGISDLTTSLTVPFVLRELAANAYGLNGRTFKDGDVILDIGANVGVVSIFLAKQLPNVTIYAYEPGGLAYNRLLMNLEHNGITNVVPIKQAVSADGRDLMLHYNTDNVGGASAIMGAPPWQYEEPVPSVTLAQVFAEHGLDRVALLKLDVEGAEHEILRGAGDLLGRIDYLAMEAHFTPALRRKGYNEGTLRRLLAPLLMRQAAHVTVLEAAA